MSGEFIYSCVWKYQLFVICQDKRTIWRIWMGNGAPLMQQLFGDEEEFYHPIRILRAMAHQYD